jgi:hypothetical protein
VRRVGRHDLSIEAVRRSEEDCGCWPFDSLRSLRAFDSVAQLAILVEWLAMSEKARPMDTLCESNGAPSMIRTCSRDAEGVARLELDSGGHDQFDEVELVRPA